MPAQVIVIGLDATESPLIKKWHAQGLATRKATIKKQGLRAV